MKYCWDQILKIALPLWGMPASRCCYLVPPKRPARILSSGSLRGSPPQCQARPSHQGTATGSCRQLDPWDSKWERRHMEPANSLSPPRAGDPGVICRSILLGVKGQDYGFCGSAKPALPPSVFFFLALRFWEGTAFAVSLAFTRWYNLVTVAVHQKPPDWG